VKNIHTRKNCIKHKNIKHTFKRDTRYKLCMLRKYTVGHKKRATLYGIITPMFRGGFLHFLYQWKQEKMLYQRITKFATLPQLCLYTT